MKTKAPPTLQFRLAWRSALLAGFLLAACSKSVAAPDELAPEEVLAPPRLHDTRTFFVPEGQPTFTALAGATGFHGIHQGIHGEAGYRIEVPDDWNGGLVMYAHGYRGTGAELRVGTPGVLRAHLITSGYAWAASSPVSDFDARLPAIKQALWVDYDTDRGVMTQQGERLRYVLSPEEVAFNGAIFRVQGEFLTHNPLRSDGVRAIPIIEGRFNVPVITVHTLETRVPFWMQQVYAERAAANGSDSWLVQRVIRSTGHCDITPEERISAFDALVNWEENGVVPAGDDVLDPQVVADPNYGCAFTLVTRTGIPAC